MINLEPSLLCLRGDVTSNWITFNPILTLNEPAIEIFNDGNVKMKIGNGVDNFLDLPYLNEADNVNSDWNSTGGLSEILNKPTTVSGYGLSDVYTINEVDFKILTIQEASNSTNGFMSINDFIKLSGISSGATKNDTDQNLKNRQNHTGTQLSNTISDFVKSVNDSQLSEIYIDNTDVTSGDTVCSSINKLQSQNSNIKSNLSSHVNNVNNPHGLTKSQIDLGYVDNTSDVNKPISISTQNALNLKVDKTTTITAGLGLTGGGDLSSSKTINVVSANDAITVNADNIQLNTIDNLTTISTTKPLSANQGKILNDKATQIETDLNGKINTTDIEQVRSQATNKVASSKLFDDLSKSLFNSFVFAGADLAVGISYINDYYLGSTGQLFSFVGYKTTDYILIKGQLQVEYIGAGHQSSVATCFYDENKIFISSIVAHGNTTINVPANAYYLRTSSNKSTTPYIQIIAKQDYDISSYYNSEVVNSISKLNAVGVELVRLHDKNLTFSGFVVVNSSTPSFSANKAYIAAESGTIFGITNVQKGQIIIDNGTSFYVQSIKSLIDYYAKTQIDQFFNNFNTLYALAGINAAANTIYTLGYITSVGGILTHTIYEYTDYIQIFGQSDITVSGNSTNSATYLCFYDKNKSFITGSAYAGSAANAILTVPTNAYYLRGTVAVGGSRLSVILNNNVDLAALKYQEKLSVTSEQIEDSVKVSNSIKETLNLNPIGGDLMSGLSLITNFYINYSGDKIGHGTATYCISPTIRLNNVKKIRYKGNLSNNTAIGFYSSDVVNSGTLVGIVKSSDQEPDYTIDINVTEGAKYMVASTYTDSITTLQLEIVEVYPVTPYNEIDEQVSVNTSDINVLKGYGMDRVPYLTREFCRHIFNSAICIGDSITQGWRTTGIFLNESYPAYLAKITGWTVMNAGQGGQTPIGWMANQFALHDYTNYDVAVICLGQNIGLTDTIDADTASGDYNTYANTNTGQYCRIIEAIKAANPNMKFMLLSRMNNGVNATWNVVYKIGLKYNIPVVSFVTNGIDNLTKTEYHPHSDTVHFGTIGNLAIANVVSKSIEKYVYDNMIDYAMYKE